MNRFSKTRCFALTLALFFLACPALAQSDKENAEQFELPDDLKVPEADPLSPEDALKSFKIEEGFEIQLVAAEPLVEDPVCMAWDEQGRLWVCEMLSYMPDLNATNEEAPVGNIVILEDTDADGKMDKRTVFMDEIILPRAIAFAKGGILYADYQSLYFVRINANGTPGARIPIDRDYSGKSNVEHQANGLLYGLDNWYYSAKSNRRYMQIGARFRRGETEFRGQWGITQDDAGRLLANGNSVPVQYELFPPTSTQRNPNFNAKGSRDKNGVLRINPAVYPIRMTPGVNRGYRPNVLDHETWKLKSATATCGPVIYRGTQFPDEYYNNVFIPEPAGNLLIRAVIRQDEGGKPSVERAYDNKEFLASTDERSRFVNAYTGPDGCLYLVDMYRGLIQHKTYVTPFLRKQIIERKLEKPLGMGRIYRVVHKATPVDHKLPNLEAMQSIALVEMLGHPNAWQRHTAQRLLVQRRDDTSVEALNSMAMTSDNPQARIHAMWTLDGMRKLTPGVLIKAGESKDPRVRVQVLRLAEQFEGETEARFFVDLMKRYSSENPGWELDLQLAFSAGPLASIDTPGAYDVLLDVIGRHSDDALFRHAAISGLKGKEAVMLAKVDSGPIKDELTGALLKAVENGGLTIGSLLALVDSPDFDAMRNELLGTLASLAVEQDRIEVVDELIARLASEDSTLENRQAILQGMASGAQSLTSPMQLDGKPKLFTQWQSSPPEGLADLIAKLDEIFVYERTVIPPEVLARIEAGAMHYGSHCSTCHGEDGDGLEGAGPPIKGSNWPGKMEPEVLAMLILNGVEGPIKINGQLYEPPKIQAVMTGFKAAPVTDQEIADILTFIRSRQMGNNADPVSVEVVAEMRKATANRDRPYSPEALEEIDRQLKGGVGGGASTGPVAHILHAGWLDASSRNLVFTLLAVTAPLALLLILTVFVGGAAKL